MWKFIANLLLTGLAILLTIFTASRTLDLLGQWLPTNQQDMQWLGLAAFEGGLYFWAFYFIKAAKGAAQRGISILMMFICFVGVAVACIMDVLLDGAADGKLPDIPAGEKQEIVIFVCVIIVLNVAAFLAAKLTSPETLKEIAIQDAEDQIEQMELRLIRKVAPGVAVRMAPIKAEQWVNDVWNRMLPETAHSLPAGMVEGSLQSSAPLPEPPTTSSPSPTRRPSAPAPEPVKQPNWFQRTFGRTKPTSSPNHAEWAAKQDQAEQDAQMAEFLAWKKQQQQPTASETNVQDTPGSPPVEQEHVIWRPSQPATSPLSPEEMSAWIEVYQRNPDKNAITFDDFLRKATSSPFPVTPTGNHNGNGASHSPKL